MVEVLIIYLTFHAVILIITKFVWDLGIKFSSQIIGELISKKVQIIFLIIDAV